MKKDELVKAAREAGDRVGASIPAEWTYEQAKGEALTDSEDHMRGVTTSSVYREAYLGAYHQAWLVRHNQLPDVRAENRVNLIKAVLENLDICAKDDLALFLRNFSDSPKHAFEWAEKSVEASAQQYVAQLLREVVAEKGPEAAVEYAEKQALRNARWPRQSTSAMSNLAGRYETAAFAEFVSRVNE